MVRRYSLDYDWNEYGAKVMRKVSSEANSLEEAKLGIPINPPLKIGIDT